MSKLIPVSLYLPPGLLARLRAEHVRTGAPMAELVRRALLAFLPAAPEEGSPDGPPQT